MLRRPRPPAVTLRPSHTADSRAPALCLLLSLPCPSGPGRGNPWAAASVTLPGLSDTLARPTELMEREIRGSLTCDQDSGHGECPWASSRMEPARSSGPSSPRGALYPSPLWWNPPLLRFAFPSYLFSFFSSSFCPYCPLSQPLSHYTTAWAKNTSGSRDQTQTEQDADLMRLPWKQGSFSRQKNVSAPGKGGGQGSMWRGGGDAG